MTSPEGTDYPLRFVFEAEGDEERDGDTLRWDALAGLTAPELADLQQELPLPAEVSVRRGSVGVGAATDGVELLLLIERAVNDAASFVELGTAAYMALRWVARKRRKRPIVSDLGTHTALAAAAEGVPELLEGMEHISTVSLDRESEAGHDARNLYQTTFGGLDRVVVVFTSGEGFMIGYTIVPRVLDLSDYTHRSPSEVRRLFREWNS